MPHIPFCKELLKDEFEKTAWIEESGLSHEELENAVRDIEKNAPTPAVAKARMLLLLAEKSRIAVDKHDIFQDKLYGGRLIADRRWHWERAFLDHELKEKRAATDIFCEVGAISANGDYGHTSPNTQLLLEKGFSGLLSTIEKYRSEKAHTEKELLFYEACETAVSAVITLARRLAEAVAPYQPECRDALLSIAGGAPKTTYEAMQLIILYFFFHEYVGATRVRTLGRLDVLLTPFYENDLKNGILSKEDFKELLRFFLYKFWVAKVPFDLPFCIGGTDENGNEVTNEVTRLIVEVYNELDIHSPKIHVRVSDKTPNDFLLLVLSAIRGGNSSFVFINEAVGEKALVAVGIEPKDAKNFVPIGCYEPAVWGVEIGCTGNGTLNLAKAVELVLTGGCDAATGKRVCHIPAPNDYDGFLKAVFDTVTYLADTAMGFVREIEAFYDRITPDPLLSAQYEESLRRGVDVFAGGAKYNNSSLNVLGIASITDSILAVKRFVYDEKRLTLSDFAEILKRNWEGNEALRLDALRLPEKYGNGNDAADSLAKEIAHHVALAVTNKKNGRGGVFKAGLYSIDFCFSDGKKTMATPDGRLAGETLSKNLCAVTGMDKNGVTGIIRSVTAIDLSEFPNGSVLDVVLHPSTVRGDKGLLAFLGLLLTYFREGGFALHGNVFNAEDLRRAQKDPDKYRTLQVRVCGWNAYFVDLSEEQQNDFIRHAENRMGEG